MAAFRSRLFAALALLSALACFAAGVLWLYSYQVYDQGHVYVGGQLFRFESACGDVRIAWNSNDLPAEPTFLRRAYLKDSGVANGLKPLRMQWIGFGFAYSSMSMRRAADATVLRTINLPHWFLMVIMTPLPLAWMIVDRRRKLERKRQAEGMCRRCGYDIGACGDRCTECGEPTPRGLRALAKAA